MSKGYAYLLHRHSTKIRFLCPTECTRFERGVDPRTIKSDHSMIGRVRDIVGRDKFDWEFCVEPGSVEQIIENWREKGRKIVPGRYVPEIRPSPSGPAITSSVVCGQRP